MKRLIAKETQMVDFQGDMRATKEWLTQTTLKIHRKMLESFNIGFTYFTDIKIVKQAELLKQLAQRMRNDLKENGIAYSDIDWRQVFEGLLRNQVPGFFGNLAFYNPKDEVLYMSEKMVTDHPERIIPICAHELSEKLLSTYLSPPSEAPVQALAKKCIEAKKTNGAEKLNDLLNTYMNTVFKSIFKEGCCEAIALQTLRSMGYESEVTSLERELLTGHAKSIAFLLAIENGRRGKRASETEMAPQGGKRRIPAATNDDNLVKEVFRGSQIIKGLSYYLGYPVAKAVLERYGIKGVKLALEKSPPLKARYFANPREYLTLLEKTARIERPRG